MGFPTFRHSISASSSPCSSTSVASRRSSLPRSAGVTARQAGYALCARATTSSVFLDSRLLELRDRLLGGRVDDGERHRPALEAATLAHSPDSETNQAKTNEQQGDDRENLAACAQGAFAERPPMNAIERTM